MSEFDRREFLKIIGVGAGAAAASGCSDPVEKLIPYVVQPEVITPGLPVVYASTCQECPSACGLHVRTLQGRPVKLEGNPEHPVNRGALCARGQAAIGRTYHPDRFRQPMERGPDGTFVPIAWDDAVAKLAKAVQAAGPRVAVLGSEAGPTLSALIDQWLDALGGGMRVVYEPFAAEALREAAGAVFGVPTRPVFDLSDADYVLDFGADVLGTGPSPVEHARQLMASREAGRAEGRGSSLVYVGPRLNETASMADTWLPAKPGTEGILALAIARVALEGAPATAGDPGLLSGLLAEFSPEAVAPRAGVPAEDIRRIGRAVAAAKKPVAVPPGVELTSRRATATNAAVLVLNAVLGAVGNSVILPPVEAPGARDPSFRDLAKLVDAMKSGDVSVLLVHGGNPVYSLPPDSGFEEALEKVGLVVSFSPIPDETSARAHLVLPDHTTLESWGDARPRPGVWSIVQPALRPLFDTRAMGDTLLDTARAIGGDVAAAMPAGSFRSVLESAWAETDWREALQRGGVFDPETPGEAVGVTPGVARLEFKEPQLEGDGEYTLLPVQHSLLGDGRGAHLPWLQETPDPITKICWQSWAEVSEKTAAELGLKPGDVIAVETPYGALEVPVWPRGGIRDDVVAIPTGQGHTVGRYASLEGVGLPGEKRGVNVVTLLPSLTDESGGRAWLTAKARITPTGRFERLPFTQGTDNKRGRLLGEAIPAATLARGEHPWAPNEAPLAAAAGAVGAAHGAPTRHGGPHPEAFEPGPPEEEGHGHEGPHEILRAFDPTLDSEPTSPFRWGMAIDIDKCTGCSACVVACYVENNIPIVGEPGVLRSRQMSWLRIERYVGEGHQELETGRPGPRNHESLGNTDVRNSPMLCQQCGAAPCEPVCPVIATYHTGAGLNGMIYNRCIGTRYCSNNCPYKVRRFNWFDYQIETWPEPMGLMLNPDVTVRGQGVMEKCTFCIQRIQAGRQDALDAGRAAPVDGGVQTACQQTCPTNAIVFGNLKEEDSRVRQVIAANENRSYHALHVLNTRPAITYLAKVREDAGPETSQHAASDSDRPERNA